WFLLPRDRQSLHRIAALPAGYPEEYYRPLKYQNSVAILRNAFPKPALVPLPPQISKDYRRLDGYYPNSDFAVLWDQHHNAVRIFEFSSRRMIFSQSFSSTPESIVKDLPWRLLTDGTYFALLPGAVYLAWRSDEKALLFTRDRFIGQAGNPGTLWRFGRDGTVWSGVDVWFFELPKAVTVLPWRLGTAVPRKVLLPSSEHFVTDLTVGADGALIAYSEFIPQTRTLRAISNGSRWLKPDKFVPGGWQRVILLHNGRQVGTYTQPIFDVDTSIGVDRLSSVIQASHRVLFTPDDKYLVWYDRLTEDRSNAKHVFPTGL
ncbi:MAG: hypothetical protein ACYC6A_11120, partial [Armatimonadota bacterium]